MKKTKSETKKVKTEKFWKKGNNYIIRTVTFIYTGKLVSINEFEVLLSDCCWIADTGRFSNALKNGVQSERGSEIEPFNKGLVCIGRGSIVDASVYIHSLPIIQK